MNYSRNRRESSDGERTKERNKREIMKTNINGEHDEGRKIMQQLSFRFEYLKYNKQEPKYLDI